MHSGRWASLSWVVVAASCCAGSFGACTSYTAETAAGDSDASTTGATADAAAAGLADAGDADNPDRVDPLGCVLDTPDGIGVACLDAEFGVFVRAGATTGDGSKAHPFGTVAQALLALGTRTNVFVATGTYDESIRLDGQSVSFFGGFSPTFDDAPPRVGASTFRAAGSAVLEVHGGQRMRFEDLVVSVREAVGGRPTGSSVAVLINQAGTADAPVTLRRVQINAGDGGDTPLQPPLGAAPMCDVPGPGACSSATAMGGAGTNFGDPATAGQPTDDGGGKAGNVVTRVSGLCVGGTAGGRGADRTKAGAPGVAAARYGLSDGSIDGLAGTGGGAGPQGAGGGGGGATSENDTQGGSGGCGGCGGIGGASGKPGGLSVSLLVVGSTVTLDRCTLQAANGGRGGDGQAGGAGGPGRVSNDGMGPASCWKAGGLGGHGGPGGHGAGGAGGSSLCILHDRTAVVTTLDHTCFKGEAGAPGEGEDRAHDGPAGIAVSQALLDDDGQIVAAP